MIPEISHDPQPFPRLVQLPNNIVGCQQHNGGGDVCPEKQDKKENADNEDKPEILVSVTGTSQNYCRLP